MTFERRLWLGMWISILPVTFYFLLGLFLLDTFDFSSTWVNTVTMVVAGALAGLVIGVGLGLRDWRIVVPPVAAGLVGLTLYPLGERAR